MQTVADLAAHGQLGSDNYLKQLLGQINLQLRRLVQGHTSLPEAMLRDALFFVAQATEPTSEARQLRDAYGLDGQVPHDYLERRYGRIDREALKDAKEALAQTKEGWDRIATEGAPAQEADFDASLAKLAGASEKLGAPQLALLLRELGEAARQAVTGGHNDQFSMEMAAAMLFVEHGLDQVRQLPSASACWRWRRARPRPKPRSGRANWRANCSRARPWPCWRARSAPACARSRS
jgi:chemosensory pili system protein ChpA (sensor histidine kinase/response regulator)